MDYKEKVIALLNSKELTKEQKEKLKEIFPKLKESEDERIRKELIMMVKLSCTDGDDVDKKIAWLEKQAEHKKFCDSIQVGDKVTRNEDGVLVNLSQLNRVAKPAEKQGKNSMGISEATKQKLEDNLNKALEKETPESWNEFLEKQGEQKPIWSEKDEEMLKMVIKLCEQYGNEYAYYWLKSLKDRILPQPKQEWSGVDEAMWAEISDLLWEGYKQSGSKFSWDDIRNWINPKLKSLRPQNRWKPSEEQINALAKNVEYVNVGCTQHILKELLEDLKKLKS